MPVIINNLQQSGLQVDPSPFAQPITSSVCLCLQPNVGRYTTGVWTRQYLEQQLVMILAGRAAEELVFGREEMSSLHQHKIMQARQVRARRRCQGGPRQWGARGELKTGWNALPVVDLSHLITRGSEPCVCLGAVHLTELYIPIMSHFCHYFPLSCRLYTRC